MEICGIGIAIIVLMAHASTTAAAAPCAVTGEPAPGVVTLMASKTSPATVAWIVSPDCTVEPVELSASEETVGPLFVDAKSIERVVSVPTDTTHIEIAQNSLSRGADFSMGRQITMLVLSSVPADPASFVLPPYLRKFIFLSEGTELTSLDGVRLPASIESQTLSETKIKSFKNVQLPAKLEALQVPGAPSLAAIDFQLPADLEIFSLSGANVGTYERATLPNALTFFSCYKCGLTTIRGVKWPASLKTLNLNENPITSFEIRRSDVALFNKIQLGAKFTQTACTETASLETVASLRFCVISDADFEKLYGSRSVTTTSPPSGSTGDSSSTSSNNPTTNSKEGSSPNDSETTSSRSGAGESSPSSTAGGPSNGGSTDSGANETSISPDGKPQTATNPPTNLSTRSPTDTPLAGTTDSSTTKSPGTLITIVVSGVVSLVVAAVLYLAFILRKRRQQKQKAVTTDTPTDKFDLKETPSMTAISRSHDRPETVEYSTALDSHAVDFRSDKELLRFRIEQVQIGTQIARGGYGVVYRGSFEGRTVAIKQMLPDAWRNDSTVAAFVDEIRMCARLDHPKIVEFIGVSWTRVRDLSVVTEFMTGGDLYSVLRTHPDGSGQEWMGPWGVNGLRNKTLIGMDIAEAVVYLHSFNTPIIHRDLKAKNVLLDHVGNAKLSDFGISREMSIDETMTSEIGTAAWIAPEVLRGERYSEKADIYSLGVLLVELDRCSHPYANEPVLLMGSSAHHGRISSGGAAGRADTSRVAHKNTQIAVLVSTGRLKPSLSSQCPANVASVVEQCLRYEPSERPTTMEMFYQLRQVQKSFEAGEGVC